LDFAVLDAVRADFNTLRGARDNRVDFLQVDVPAALRHVVRVADPVSKLGAAPAKITHFRHFLQSLLVLIVQNQPSTSGDPVGEWVVAVSNNVMNHAYIDVNSIAERYLDRALSAEQLREFEEHIVDCQECADRLLLAEMFHARNGHKAKPDEKMVARVVLYKPKRVILMLIAAGVAVPVGYLLWWLSWRG
jgi:hypothetical protein